jgi:hypothetical protein
LNAETLKLFYTLKPLLPRRVQLLLRQIRAKSIFKQTEPPYLVGLDNKDMLIPPDGYDCVVLLTHDVETADGLKKIELIREAEREYGVPSTWNFVLKKYGSPEKYISKLRKEGCECGAHGLYHDGKLFQDYDTYRSRMDQIVTISEQLGLEGFRSPALHRNAEWMLDLPFKWDSSFPAWDPFQPQPGGCKKYLPFPLNPHTLELPVTLFQDYTLFYELKQKVTDIWVAQSSTLAKQKQLININVHPDYINVRTLLLYKEILRHFINELNAYVANPSELCYGLAKVT